MTIRRFRSDRPEDAIISHREQSHVFEIESEGIGDDLDGFISDVTIIAQSRCERYEGYGDIETLVCCLPIGHLTFAAHDSLAPYSGSYPMALLVRAFIIEEINSWDDTALHDHLYANPSLLCALGFETLPAQSTFWRTWNNRFSGELRDAVEDCADVIVRAARACDVSFPDRIDTDDRRMDVTTFIHMIERMIHRYRHRWGIENGFRKQKHFMVRTTSAERNYRFFNFAFACVLYNVWRLVDLLVKLAIDGEYRTYAPLVDANQFLTVAKQFYDLDLPD